MPEDKEQFALPMNGKKMNLRKKDFLIFAENFGISRTSANKMIESILNRKQKILTLCETSFLPEHLKQRFSDLLLERMRILE